MRVEIRKIKLLGGILLAILLALMAATAIGTEDYKLVALAFIGVAGIIAVHAFPAWITVLTIVVAGMSGRSELKIGYFELFTLALLVQIVGLGALKARAFKVITGHFTLGCIFVVTGILVMHALKGGPGKRIALLAATVALFCYLLLSGLADMRKIRFLPLVGLFPGLVLTAFDIINLLIPAAFPITAMLYDQQNWEIRAAFSGAQFDFIRLAGLGILGGGIGMMTVVYFAVERRMTFTRFSLYSAGLFLSAALTMFSGYRSAFAAVAFQVLVGAYTRSRILLGPIIIAGVVAIGLLILTQNSGVDLPRPVQRALSFLPGDWDMRIKKEADDGYAWRAQLRDTFFSKYFYNRPWLGRGLDYDDNIGNAEWMTQESEAKQIIWFGYMQAWHNGFVSCLDFVGIIGTGFLILGCLRGIWNSWIVFNSRRWIHAWHLYVALGFATTMAIFWVNGFINQSLPFICVSLALLELANREIKEAKAADLLSTRDAIPTLLGDEATKVRPRVVPGR